MQFGKIIFSLCLLFTTSLSAMEENDFYQISTAQETKTRFVSILLTKTRADNFIEFLRLFPREKAFIFPEQQNLQIYNYGGKVFSLNHGMELDVATAGLRIEVANNEVTIKLNEAANQTFSSREAKVDFLRENIKIINRYFAREKRRQEIPDYVSLENIFLFFDRYEKIVKSSDDQEQWNTMKKEFIAQQPRDFLPIEAYEKSISDDGSVNFTLEEAKIFVEWSQLFSQKNWYVLNKNIRGTFQVYRDTIFSIQYRETDEGLNIDIGENQVIVTLNAVAAKKYSTKEDKQTFTLGMIRDVNDYLRLEKKRVEFPAHIPLVAIYKFFYNLRRGIQCFNEKGTEGEIELYKDLKAKFIAGYPQ